MTPAPDKARRALALGAFDLFHVGHLRYLQYAHSLCDHLSVGVAADGDVRATKGRAPIVSQAERMEIIRALRCVDDVFLAPTSTENTAASLGWIPALGVQLVVAGGEWRHSERWGRLTPGLEHAGVRVVFAPRTDGVSTSILREKILRTPQDGQFK